MRWLALVLAALLSSGLAFGQTVEECHDSPDPARQIAGCTEPRLCARQHAFERALSDLNDAVEVDPNSPLAYYNRGNLYFDLENYDKAVSDFDKAIARDPKFALAYLNRGLSNENLGRRAASAADYRAALQRDPTLASRLPACTELRRNSVSIGPSARTGERE